MTIISSIGGLVNNIYQNEKTGLAHIFGVQEEEITPSTIGLVMVAAAFPWISIPLAEIAGMSGCGPITEKPTENPSVSIASVSISPKNDVFVGETVTLSANLTEIDEDGKVTEITNDDQSYIVRWTIGAETKDGYSVTFKKDTIDGGSQQFSVSATLLMKDSTGEDVVLTGPTSYGTITVREKGLASYAAPLAYTNNVFSFYTPEGEATQLTEYADTWGYAQLANISYSDYSAPLTAAEITLSNANGNISLQTLLDNAGEYRVQQPVAGQPDPVEVASCIVSYNTDTTTGQLDLACQFATSDEVALSNPFINITLADQRPAQTVPPQVTYSIYAPEVVDAVILPEAVNAGAVKQFSLSPLPTGIETFGWEASYNWCDISSTANPCSNTLNSNTGDFYFPDPGVEGATADITYTFKTGYVDANGTTREASETRLGVSIYQP